MARAATYLRRSSRHRRRQYGNVGGIPKGNLYLKTALVEAANAAARAKGTYLRDKFYRLKARRGKIVEGGSGETKTSRDYCH